jgi:hypothetical protein
MTGAFVRRIIHAIVGVLVLSLLGACGGAPEAAAPRAPSQHGRQTRRELVTAIGGDRDADGIVDKVDEAPEDAPARGNLMGAPPPPPPPPPADAKKTEQGQPVAPGPEDKRETQLIVYTARVTMAVYQVETGLQAVEKIARDMGGYLALKRDREITIRVPRGRFEPALAAIDKIGDVIHRDIQAQDVTDEYVDLEIRIKNARAMQTRLKQLLERAPVKEALEIEKELARVTQELELLEGKIKLLRDKIAYSTITVMFEPRGSTIQATRIRLPFPWLQQLGLPSLLSLSEVK